MKKIVVACDSMKGSLSSADVARVACQGIRDISPDTVAMGVSVADGGEGTAISMTEALGGKWVSVLVDGPLRRKVEAAYGIVMVDGELTAVIDMASASGLTLLAPSERNPLVTTTYGTGELMVKAWDAGCRHFIIGIGGSATNDAGKGMLEALGIKFLDRDGHQLADGGASLGRLATIDMSNARRDILGSDIVVMCDVANILCGPEGASAVYGPQKGANPTMVIELDSALRHFANVVENTFGINVADYPGAGAAGGLGAGFMAFTDAKIQKGIDTVLDIMDFDRLISDADLVITGEGRIDSQTLNGKVPYGVMQRCLKQNVPVVVIAGSVADAEAVAKAGFDGVFSILQSPMSLEEAMNPEVAAANVRFTCSQIFKLFRV